MKILKVNYSKWDKKVYFVVEGDTSTSHGLVNGKNVIKEVQNTQCIKLEGKTTIKQVTDELKAMITADDSEEETFNTLNVKGLEGTDI